jgi:DNA-binding GntR family transcriptional regulator
VLSELRESAAANDRERFARSDALLHDELCRLSGNGRLHRVFSQHGRLLGTLLRPRNTAIVKVPHTTTPDIPGVCATASRESGSLFASARSVASP